MRYPGMARTLGFGVLLLWSTAGRAVAHASGAESSSSSASSAGSEGLYLGLPGRTVPAEAVRDRVVSDPEDYEGEYHFGESEMESTVRVLVEGDRVHLQRQSGHFADGGRAWVRGWTNHSGSLEGARVKAGELSARFVEYLADEAPHPGLILGSELGLRTSGVLISGDYPQASARLLEPDDLADLTADQLRVMRNEIFARYGHVFRSGGAMDRHFRAQDWYQPQAGDASRYFTEIERANIRLIQKQEQAASPASGPG